MSNAINLSKDWTLSRILGMLRILVNEIAPDKIQDLELIDLIHLAVCDVAELLSAASFPDYGVNVVVTQSSNVIDISSLRIDSITKLFDATNKLCIEVDPSEYENLITIIQKQSNIFWTQIGENIYLYKPTALVYGVLTLFYNRIPVKVTDTTDTLDMKDQFMKLVLDKTKIMIYETLKQTPPEALTNAVNNSIAQIRQSNLEEYQISQK